MLALQPQSVATKAKKDKEIYNYYQLFADVYDKIVNFYVDETDPSILFEGAIRGMIEILDRNNFYLSAEDISDGVLEKLPGNAYGLVLGVKDDKLLVISSVMGSAGAEAGLTSGDWIWSIGDTLIGTLPSLLENYKLLLEPDRAAEVTSKPATVNNGPTSAPKNDQQTNSEGLQKTRNDNDTTGLGITYLRGEKAEIFKRETMSLQTRIKTAEPETGVIGPAANVVYIHPSQISTLAEFEQLLQQTGLRQSNSLQTLVLDLRQIYQLNCQTAIEIASLFLPANKVITVLHYFDKIAPEPSITHTEGDFAKRLMAVLVDQGTAGGAEILAAALSSRRGCQSIGQKTFGYAFKQAQLPVASGGTIYLVAGVYHTPEGRPLYPDSFSPVVGIDNPLAPHEWRKMSLSERSIKDAVLVQAINHLQGAMTAVRNK